MPFSADDYRYMARAQQLSVRGLYTTEPNPRVGCVLVRDGRIVGEGFHQRAGEPHAEVYALRAAGEAARGATAYVTLEPCAHTGRTPPCAKALIDAGVSRVVAALQDPNPLVAGKGLAMLRDAGIETAHGLLATQTRAHNPGFLKRMQYGRPFVRLKLAMSLDGRTAMASGESQWITGAEARQDVQTLRGRAGAILTGIGTVLADDPSLNVRLQTTDPHNSAPLHQPVPVIVDSHLRCPPAARLFGLHSRVVLAHTAATGPATLTLPPSADCRHLPDDGQGRVNLPALLRLLALQLQINEVHAECGAVLAGALLQQQLVDELVIYMAPKLLGSDARGLLVMPQLQSLAQAVSLNIERIDAVGADLRIIARPDYPDDVEPNRNR